jgi:flagellar biosynthetic protein FliO
MATIQVISGILLVFGLLALFYWMANRLNGGRGFRPGNSRIEIVEARNIGDKRTLLLVKVGNENFLLGATGSQISMLSPLPSESLETAADEDTDPEAEPREVGFRGLLEMLR